MELVNNTTQGAEPSPGPEQTTGQQLSVSQTKDQNAVSSTQQTAGEQLGVGPSQDEQATTAPQETTGQQVSAIPPHDENTTAAFQQTASQQLPVPETQRQNEIEAPQQLTLEQAMKRLKEALKAQAATANDHKAQGELLARMQQVNADLRELNAIYKSKMKEYEEANEEYKQQLERYEQQVKVFEKNVQRYQEALASHGITHNNQVLGGHTTSAPHPSQQQELPGNLMALPIGQAKYKPQVQHFGGNDCSIQPGLANMMHAPVCHNNPNPAKHLMATQHQFGSPAGGKNPFSGGGQNIPMPPAKRQKVESSAFGDGYLDPALLDPALGATNGQAMAFGQQDLGQQDLGQQDLGQQAFNSGHQPNTGGHMSALDIINHALSQQGGLEPGLSGPQQMLPAATMPAGAFNEFNYDPPVAPFADMSPSVPADMQHMNMSNEHINFGGQNQAGGVPGGTSTSSSALSELPSDIGEEYVPPGAAPVPAPVPAPFPAPVPVPAPAPAAAGTGQAVAHPAQYFLHLVPTSVDTDHLSKKPRFRKARRNVPDNGTRRGNRPWIFAYMMPGSSEVALYVLKCPRQGCDAFYTNPLMNNRGINHLREHGLDIEDELDMMRQYGAQVLGGATKGPLTIEWARTWNLDVLRDNNIGHLASENL